MDMIASKILPRFVIIKYIARLFVNTYGALSYYIVCIVLSLIIIVYFEAKAIKSKKWDTAIMIVIFALILIGSIVAIGMEVSQVG